MTRPGMQGIQGKGGRGLSSRCPRRGSKLFRRHAQFENIAIRADVGSAVDEALACGYVITTTNFRMAQGGVVARKREGKVRDVFELPDERLAVVTTDRQSAFDRVLAAVPFKGQVLNETAAWWMQQTEHIIPNALLSTPDPAVSVMKRCEVFPVEIIVRAYATGSTATSLWTYYNRGERTYCGHELLDGLRKNDPLPQGPIVTPSTKAEHGDVPISGEDVVRMDLMTAEHWQQCRDAALALFQYGQKEASKRGLILVDTKYEMGLDSGGQVTLIDEVHTPDSSRYWIQDSYLSRQQSGMEPENIDKEFLRLWFAEVCDPYDTSKPLPEAPAELVAELSKRYVSLFERITQQQLQLQDLREDPLERIARNMKMVDIDVSF